MKLINLSAVGITLFMLSSSLNAHGDKENATGKEQTTLKQVMHGLLKDIQMISQGIFLQDFNQISQGAEGIAHHPSPSIEVKQKLKATLAEDMKIFKSFDISVHNTAIDMTKSAKAEDMELVVKQYHQLVDGCQSCHARFKQPVAALFSD